MPAVLAVVDKFRGSLGARELSEAVAIGARRAGWSCQALELSDGGEGFARALAGEAAAIETAVTGPLGRPVTANWRLGTTGDEGGPVAVIEAAAACGLGLAGGASGNDPLLATTAGVGELIAAALERGARRVVVGCGGSASTDGGRGALEALGCFPPTPGTLLGVDIVAAYDTSTLFLDAASVFAPQKGADGAQVATLRRRLAELAELYAAGGRDVTLRPGSGAAGGLAGGLAAAGARLCSGFGLVAAATGLTERISASQAVVTGEGRLDDASFTGKVVGGVLDASAALATSGRVLVVAGSATAGGKERAEAAGAAVVVLSERFGQGRSFGDTGSLVSRVVGEWVGMLS